jgi:hypothetical protein
VVQTLNGLRKLLADYFKAINEVIVHVLDFHYFYNAVTDLYVPLLWLSWATVPAVLEHLLEYILRTLATIACAGRGRAEERFAQAVTALKEQLQSLIAGRREHLLLRHACAALEDVDSVRALRLRFIPALYLADIARSLLRSSVLHAALLAKDANVRQTDDGCRYLMDTGAWPGEDVASPTAFLSDRLRRAVMGADDGGDVEWRSAWVFLACSSALPVRGDQGHGDTK